MILRTYTADLAGPVIESGGTHAAPLRRLRAWTVTIGGPRQRLTFTRANAGPVAVDVRRGGLPPERIPVRSVEAMILGAVKAVSTAGSLVARRRP